MQQNESVQMADWHIPGVQRILAPNPGPLTGPGTNTYVLGDHGQVIIDPGPDDDRHLQAILKVAPNPKAILITHSHMDHTALVPRLAHATGATVWAFGDSSAGRDAMPDLGPAFAEGSGTDPHFQPDKTIAHGQNWQCDDISLTAHWTPGHFPNHLCFDRGDILFSGDVVMGWSTTLVSPPEGSIPLFRMACQRLMDIGPRVYLPGHGDPVPDGPARAAELVAHRNTREAQVCAALTDSPQSAMDLTRQIYRDVPVHLHPAAARNVLAHLISLTEAQKAFPTTTLTPDALFVINPENATGRRGNP